MTGTLTLSAPRSWFHRAARSGRAHWAILLVLGLFGASAFIVPTLAPVAVSDDFLYARSVYTLLSDGKLVILPATAATLVFQVGWGAVFAGIFGHSFGVLRVSTVVFTAGSSLAVYALCRELGVDKVRSALGAAIFLFNPLGYLFSFSFLTDSYFAGLLTISAFFYVRGLADDEVRDRWVLAGSITAALAFLVRHQGLLIPIAVVTYLAASGRLRRGSSPIRLLARVLFAPVVAATGYFIWFRFIHGVPPNSAQGDQLDAWLDAGFVDIAELTRSIFVFDVIFVGLFVLPLGLGAIPRLPRLIRATSKRAWLAFGASVIAVAIAALSFDATFARLRIPFVPGSLTEDGLGPVGDLRGGRVPLVSTRALALVTVACVIAAVVVMLAICARLFRSRRPANAGAWVVLSLLLWQAVGVLGPSMILRDTHLSFDRYFLPLLPLAICLALWSLHEVKLNLPIAVFATAGLALVSVAGTHDFLAYQSTTWQVARKAHEAGVPYDRLDAGAAWDGDHLYERSSKSPQTVGPPETVSPGPFFAGPALLSEHDVGAWWIVYYAPSLRDEYIVSAEPLFGFTVVRRAEYSSWLQGAPTFIYLLRRPDEP